MAILVDDRGTGAFQAPLAQFFAATFSSGRFAISMLNPQSIKLVDYTQDADALKGGLGRLGRRGELTVDGEQIIAAVDQAAKELQQRKAARPVIVVLSASGEDATSERAESALTTLRNSGASLHVLHISGIELGRVLTDGPKQSGGLIQQAGTGPAIGPALMKLSEAVLSQYVLTYTLPDGVKPSDRIGLTTSRKGVTLIAPTRISDK